MGSAQPMILVMPRGAPDRNTETAWANGTGPDAAWETFLSRDVVRWTDACFNTARGPWGRGIAGLSDGGYGALNIALHHPTEFALVESWSGYEQADPTLTSIYGSDPARLAYNSPAIHLPTAATALRRNNAFVWLYVGQDDPLAQQNADFASQLSQYGIGHVFTVVPGGHQPSVYRANLPQALRVASAHLRTRSRAVTGTVRAGRVDTRVSGCSRGRPLISAP
jgi:enterochelin esterase-like enzyme